MQLPQLFAKQQTGLCVECTKPRLQNCHGRFLCKCFFPLAVHRLLLRGDRRDGSMWNRFRSRSTTSVRIIHCASCHAWISLKRKLWIHASSLFLRGTIFHSLGFSFREFKTWLIRILRVNRDPLGSTFYGPSIIWYYGRNLARARGKHGSCLYSPFVDTQALNFRDALVIVHKTKHRVHKLDR